ncbi:excinuclease ABC subunit C [Candidatus Woesearchaeota archaeon]|nr:excinuclease ABC subunit C [Candidatus Woesearchaeota archaeon]
MSEESHRSFLEKDIKVRLPHEPGCYLYKDSSDRIIYVGKAKDLQKRVSSYFNKKDLDPKTSALVSNIYSFDFIVTSNEVEAFLLENTLIKKYYPKYNIDLKDSKRYAYIELTSEEFPRFVLSRTGIGNVFGPFVSGEERNNLLTLVNKTFKLRTCKKLPSKACLRYHIGICSAPCITEISLQSYLEDVASAKKVLNGNTKELIVELTSKMKSFSNSGEFEQALKLRNQITALENLSSKQNVERSRTYDEDVINYLVHDDRVFLIVFKVYKGTLSKKEEFSFEYSEEFFEEFLSRYYSSNSVPKEIIVPVTLSDSFVEFLSSVRGSKVICTKPERGEKKNLLSLVLKNIELSVIGDIQKLERLKEVLELSSTPYVLECFDISHLSGTSTVGSMAQFVNGKPNKSGYRRFKIRTVSGIDDFASIAEVVSRRYKKLLVENLKFPDLIVIDGGKGQLAAALKELHKLNLDIPIISLAKRDEEIFTTSSPFPISLDKKDPALHVLQALRDETHRFGITYNKLLRTKKLFEKKL